MAARLRSDRGAALVEMAIVVGLLAMFLFGIITFGVTLSFRQSLTQAANEAARAAAVAPRDLAVERARAAADRVASGWDATCDDGQGLSCTFLIAPCPAGAGDLAECMTVELRYDLAGHPRVPGLPVVSRALPEEMVVRVAVELAPAEVP